MTVEEATADDWMQDLNALKSAETGVKVVVDVRQEYFKSVYSRGGNFDSLIQRLAEHLGVMYASYLEPGHEISIRYRSRAAQDWTERPLIAILTPFLQSTEVQTRHNTIRFEVDGKTYTAEYKQGLLDTSVKDQNAERPWPYPLRIHFQGSNARCGISYVVRDRVLRTGVFREIWPEHAGDVSFNNFLGELRLGADFATTNNKTDVTIQR
ncbi:MAG: hypothetical protein M3Q29_09840 [Chloroflexota bacterium]|nr:hypothetical protein [Chloroflexota bacterium]